jgi:hypothetical protein
MSWIQDNYNKYKIGSDGESEIREWFKKLNIPFMQVDIMFYYKDKWCLGEVKTQEKFKAPPFDGHGMPEWQINRRMKFYNDTGVIPYLIVKDLEENCIYIQKIEELMNGEYIKTKGRKPRIVFNINSFKRIEL